MVKVFFKGIGYADKYLEEIKADLQRRLCVTQVGNERECDVILVLCPIVSRAGTDVEAALSAIPSRLIILFLCENAVECSRNPSRALFYSNSDNVLTVVVPVMKRL